MHDTSTIRLPKQGLDNNNVNRHDNVEGQILQDTFHPLKKL